MKNDLFLNKTESRSFEIYLRRYGADYLFILFIIHMFSTRYFVTYRICAKAPLNDHADVSNRARGSVFRLSLSLLMYFVYAMSEGSDRLV